MQVTMLKTMCGPEGNAFPGMVVEATDEQAKAWLSDGVARKYDRDKDKKAQRGPIKYVKQSNP